MSDSYNLHGSRRRKSRLVLLIIDVINDMEFPGGDKTCETMCAHGYQHFAAKEARPGRCRGEQIARALKPDESDYFVLKPKSVRVEGAGEPEQPRMLLVSVPYALRAADADTLGGKPASAYQLAQPATKNANESSRLRQNFDPAGALNNGGSTGVANYVSRFDSATTLVDSQIYDNGTTARGSSYGIAGR